MGIAVVFLFKAAFHIDQLGGHGLHSVVRIGADDDSASSILS